MSLHNTEESLHPRHFSPDNDLPRLIQLLTAVEAVDQTGEDISEATQRESLSLPGHDPLQDRWVVEAPGDPDQLIAFGFTWKAPQDDFATIYIVVHPACRLRGIGNILMQHALKRAQSIQALSVQAYASVLHRAGNAFLRKYAFEPVSAYTALHLNADIELPLPFWPAGYTMSNTARDLATFHYAFNHCFSDLTGHHIVSEEYMQDILPGQAHDGTFIAYGPDGEIVGICSGRVDEALSARRGYCTGYLDSPGVVPEHRKQGLYLPLLLAAAQQIRSQEVIDIELESWSDSEETLALYQQVGFTTLRKELIYQRSVSISG
ncbi:MAG TPA: GNAT family N-acetyltransferase [Ktedonosporobacter sp.]|nr:GNAT family N-acetyltransferase [Ktedonosporobacter sp.]